jgi:SAM-dependent methyltransferase
MTKELEPQAVAERYARRGATDRYSFLRPEVCLMVQERQRAMLRLFRRAGFTDLATKRLFEVGCGNGGNLLELLRLGFMPEHLGGVELLSDRYLSARRVLPPSVALREGDALQLDLAPSSQDIVFVSTVFSSLLDAGFQHKLASAMWRWVKPGGGVLWYDFTVDNPRNPDVRGVPMRRVRGLFPDGQHDVCRVTLAPPISRRVTRVHPVLYAALNLLPFLRTHVLVWIAKPL